MNRFLAVALCSLVATLLLPPIAGALTVRKTSTVGETFEGASCGSSDLATLTLPAGARRPSVLSPEVGEVLASSEDDVTPVAEITQNPLHRVNSRWVAFFVATGSDDVCQQPANYPDGWITVDIDLSVTYVTRERVYVATTPGAPLRRRPATLQLRGGDTLRGLRWSSWDGRVARARGVARIDTSDGRASYPVAVRLTRPTLCGDRYQYFGLRYTYLGTVPQGRNRSPTATFESAC